MRDNTKNRQSLFDGNKSPVPFLGRNPKSFWAHFLACDCYLPDQINKYDLNCSVWSRLKLVWLLDSEHGTDEPCPSTVWFGRSRNRKLYLGEKGRRHRTDCMSDTPKITKTLGVELTKCLEFRFVFLFWLCFDSSDVRCSSILVSWLLWCSL